MFKLPDTTADGRGIERASWIVSVWSRCMPYTDDASYPPRDNTTDVLKRSHLRQNRAPLAEMWSSEYRSKLNLFNIAAIESWMNIDRHENSYMNFGREYTFPKARSNIESRYILFK